MSQSLFVSCYYYIICFRSMYVRKQKQLFLGGAKRKLTLLYMQLSRMDYKTVCHVDHYIV